MNEAVKRNDLGTCQKLLQYGFSPNLLIILFLSLLEKSSPLTQGYG